MGQTRHDSLVLGGTLPLRVNARWWLSMLQCASMCRPVAGANTWGRLLALGGGRRGSAAQESDLTSEVVIHIQLVLCVQLLPEEPFHASATASTSLHDSPSQRAGGLGGAPPGLSRDDHKRIQFKTFLFMSTTDPSIGLSFHQLSAKIDKNHPSTMKLLAAMLAAAALALGTADTCTLTTDAAAGIGNGCTDIAKCVDSLTVTFTGTSGSIELPSGCAETGTMENVAVTAAAIGGLKGALSIGYVKQSDIVQLVASLSSTSPASCTSPANVTAGSCLGFSPGGASPSASAASRTSATVVGIGAAALAASVAMFL